MKRILANVLVLLLSGGPLCADFIEYRPPGGGVALGDTNIWTGSNTFTDSLFTLRDNLDTTKQAQFQLTGLSPGVTRSFTLPDTNDTLAVLSSTQTFSGPQTFSVNNTSFNATVTFGGTTAAFPICSWNTVQTPDTFTCGLGTTSRTWVIHEAGDEGFDFAHALQPNPTIIVHSAAQSTTQWVGLTHDGTNAVITRGTGFLDFFSQGIIGTGTLSYRAGAGTEIGWSSSGSAQLGTTDLLLTRSAAATLQLGAADAAAPVAQTLRAQGSRGGTDTNVAGAAVSIGPGLGTGTAAQSIVGVLYPETKATGTTAQTYSAAFPPNTAMFTATADATAGNSVSELTIVGTGVGTKTLDAGLLRAGRTLRFTVQGFITNTATPTLNIKIKAGSTILASTGAQTTTTITGTRAFIATATATCRTVGATGTMYTQGTFSYDTNVTGFAMEDMVSSATVTLDTTASQALDVTATWGTANVSNTMTGTNVMIEIVN